MMAAGIVVKHETSAQSSALLWTWWLQRWSATELFQHALLDLEGFSKHRHSAYLAGRFDRWVKNKNRSHPAFRRMINQFG